MPKVWITAYDIFSARIAEKAGVDTVLVGDSLGMTVYGMENTHGVTVEMMLRHAKAVQKGAPNTRIVVDFPFGTTHDVLAARETAEIFANEGFKTFKIEGGIEKLSIIMELKARGFEIVGHLGFLPQYEKKWRLHGSTQKEATKIYEAVQKFAALGIRDIVVECVPEEVGKKAQKIFSTKTNGEGNIIGIGAGRYVNGQVLVFDDVVGRTPKSFQPRFLQRYGQAGEDALFSVQNFISAVEEKKFPEEGNVY